MCEQHIEIIASVTREIAQLLTVLDNRINDIYADREIHTNNISGIQVVIIQSGHSKTVTAIAATILIE